MLLSCIGKEPMGRREVWATRNRLGSVSFEVKNAVFCDVAPCDY
jgi:hypothetical protein